VNTITPFRRLTLEHEGCAPRRHALALAVACYKGDASQSQSSTQTGAQTQGAVTQGNQNQVVTGTAVNTGAQANTPNSQANSGVVAGNGSTIQITTSDQGTINDAAKTVEAALQAIQGSSTAASGVATQAVQATQQQQQDNQAILNQLATKVGTVPQWLLYAGGAAVVGIVGLVFFTRKKA